VWNSKGSSIRNGSRAWALGNSVGCYLTSSAGSKPGRAGRAFAGVLGPIASTPYRNLAMPHQSISFPILCIARNGFLTSVLDRDALEICGQSAFASGYFDGLLLFTSTGKWCPVKSAVKVANVGPLAGWRLLKSRQIRVRLELAEVRDVALPEIQELVCDAIDRLPAQWEAVEKTNDTKARVMAAVTVRELINLFAGQS
jgi:hypothetical protein